MDNLSKSSLLGVRGDIKERELYPLTTSVIAHQKRLVCGLKTYRL
ncbi:hypothetical protein HPNQ4161_0250 [Helicobacter pylori NQ4161]|nr:hypothetical protein HPNQ4161_0250 [Helicobacter pylori NQ4161]